MAVTDYDVQSREIVFRNIKMIRIFGQVPQLILILGIVMYVGGLKADAVERLIDGFDDRLRNAESADQVISIPLLNMTSAAPLSVVLSLLSQRKEGKRGRSVSHV